MVAGGRQPAGPAPVDSRASAPCRGGAITGRFRATITTGRTETAGPAPESGRGPRVRSLLAGLGATRARWLSARLKRDEPLHLGEEAWWPGTAEEMTRLASDDNQQVPTENELMKLCEGGLDRRRRGDWHCQEMRPMPSSHTRQPDRDFQASGGRGLVERPIATPIRPSTDHQQRCRAPDHLEARPVSEQVGHDERDRGRPATRRKASVGPVRLGNCGAEGNTGSAASPELHQHARGG